MRRAVHGFKGREQKEDHFWNHNREFEPEFASPDAYESAAIEFLSRELGNTILECVRRNGDVIRFDTRSNEFAICDRDGYLKTYYKPDIYWHRQASNLIYFEEQCNK
jgi:pyocin large subunit-like protein